MTSQHADTDILIVGGGLGGCAAALAATSLGSRVILSEETGWIGGQLTAQAVPPDEHPWIEQFGCTRRYRALRNGIRRYYRDHYPLTAAARASAALNPGQAWVSRIAHEPRVALAVLEGLMAYPQSAGQLAIKRHRVPVTVETDGDRLRAVTLRHVTTGDLETISARYILDATELGDLLPLAGVEYVTGAESQRDTGEPHALPGDPEPGDVQALTWCFAMAYGPEADHTVDKPAGYDRWRAYVPRLDPPWPGRMLAWRYTDPISRQPTSRRLFPDPSDPHAFSFWAYRRVVFAGHYAPESAPHEVTIANWPQNDYLEGNIIDQPEAEVARHLEEARQLSLALFYWLQTEAPRPDGGTGYGGLYLRPDVTGTADGLAMAPYIRESRRIRARFTVTENHVATAAREEPAAAHFKDSVGIGCYRLDLHPSTGGRNYVDISSLPFQIPLGALIPVRVENLIPACKNIGTTHISNGCYRLHPVEWNIGEAAGLLAAFCLDRGLTPAQVHVDAALTADFQTLLRAQGIEIEWPSPGPV